MKKELSKSKKPAGILLSLFLLLALYCCLENTSIEVTEFSVKSTHLPTAFDGYRIVQVSDLHNTEFGKNQCRLIEKIKTAKPDIIAVTGDLIDSEEIDHALAFIKQAVLIAPVCYVTGNHESGLAVYPELKKQMEAAGVLLLDNQFLLLQKEEETIAILGLADPAFGANSAASLAGLLEAAAEEFTAEQKLSGQPVTEAVSTEQPNLPYTILLSHRPELFDLYTSQRVNLALTGHAHGGQFRIPFVGGLIAPNQGLFPDYSEGLHTKDDTSMIVSRGLGNSVIPVRINNNPELIVITLKSISEEAPADTNESSAATIQTPILTRLLPPLCGNYFVEQP